MKRKKTWREKLADSKGLPKVEPITPEMSSRWGKGTVVIPAPGEVDELMKRVPHGQVTTISEIRAKLAERHGATLCCPLTTGIFAWIAANAAEEGAQTCDPMTPYWRTLKADGLVNPKYPGGAEAAAKKLEAEGHAIDRRGTRFFVRNFNHQLYRFS